MDLRHFGPDDDERFVRAALRTAFPHERPEFSRRRGEQIIRAAAVEEAQRPPRRPMAGGRAAASVAAALTLFAGTAGVASAAMPGQPLYKLKHLVERAMVAVTTDDDAAAQLELRFAERRLEEAAAVEQQSEDDTARSLSERFDQHLQAATDLAGDDVAEEVDELEQARPATTDDTAPDPSVLETQREPEPAPAPAAAPSPTPAPSPAPSVSPSPSPSPLPSASPTPSPAPSPGPSSTPSASPTAAAPSVAPTSGTEPPTGTAPD